MPLLRPARLLLLCLPTVLTGCSAGAPGQPEAAGGPAPATTTAPSGAAGAPPAAAHPAVRHTGTAAMAPTSGAGPQAGAPPRPAAAPVEAALLLNEGIHSPAVAHLLNDTATFEAAMATLDRAYATDPDARDLQALYQQALQQRLGTSPDAPQLSRLQCGITHCLGEINGTLASPGVLFGPPSDTVGRQLPVSEAMIRSVLSAEGAATRYRLLFALAPTPPHAPVQAR